MAVITAPPAPTHDLGGTRFTALATPSRGSTDTSVWIVELDPGAAGAAHSLTREEIFVVLAGQAALTLGGRDSQAEGGDAIVVPPAMEFTLRNEGDTPLRLLCCMPVGGRARLADGSMLTPPWSE